MIDISGADKVEVLLRLYNHGHNDAMMKEKWKDYRLADLAAIQSRMLPTMTREQAERLIAAGDLSFDYLGARKFLVDLSGDTFDEWGYDRDSAPGQARRALEGCPGVKFL